MLMLKAFGRFVVVILITFGLSIITLQLSRQWFALTPREEWIAINAAGIGATVTMVMTQLLGWFLPLSMMDPKKRVKRENGEHVPTREEVLKDPDNLSIKWMRRARREGRWHKDGRND